MTTLVANRDAPVRRHRRAPWSPRAWGEAFYLAAGIPAQAAGLLIPYFLVRVGIRANWWAWPAGAAWLAGFVSVFLVFPVLTGMQRHRLRVTAGVEIPPQPVIPHRLSGQGIATAVRSPAVWRQLCYHLLAGPALAVAAVAAAGAWLAGFLYTFSLLYA